MVQNSFNAGTVTERVLPVTELPVAECVATRNLKNLELRAAGMKQLPVLGQSLKYRHISKHNVRGKEPNGDYRKHQGNKGQKKKLNVIWNVLHGCWMVEGQQWPKHCRFTVI